jgi:hypothetical protein
MIELAQLIRDHAPQHGDIEDAQRELRRMTAVLGLQI